MKRFFVDFYLQTGMTTPLDSESHAHFARVLRGQQNEKIILCCGDGFDYIATVLSVTKNETLVEIKEKTPNNKESKVDVTLFMSVLKGDKNELVVQKATEIGVKKIVPFYSSFSNGKLEKPKIERLGKIILESAKQCGRAAFPIITSPIEFSEIINEIKNYDLVAFPYEKEEHFSLKSLLNNCNEGGKIKSAAVIIGSEGGFSDDEAKILKANGIKSVTLGERILRAETASIAVLAILFYELGEMERARLEYER